MTRERIDEMLGRLQYEEGSLNEWETDFLSSVTDQFDRTGTLSRKQVEILEGIYSKVSGE